MAERSPLALLPAIDLAGGRCVRLVHGDFSAETDYGDAVEVARAYVAAGAAGLHVVDLDAARTGEPANRAVVAEIISAVPLPVQLGGGLRDEAAIEAAIELGAARVVVGTAGVEHPELLAEMAARYPGRIVLGLDHRRGASGRSRREVAVRGWQEGSGIDLLDALDEVAELPLGAVLITDISADGTLSGPDLEGYRLALGDSALPILASGGVGTAADLAALSALEEAGRVLTGVVVGKALLSGAISLQEAVAACAR